MLQTTSGDKARVRLATHADIITAARMVFESYAPYIPIMGKVPPTIFEDFGLYITQGNLWLMESQRTTLGMVVLTPQLDHMLLQCMCILPEHQGKGYGQTLMQFCEVKTHESGLSCLKLYTNSLMERNQKIYKKQGFKETHRTPYDWGWRVHMSKKLDESISAVAMQTSHNFD